MSCVTKFETERLIAKTAVKEECLRMAEIQASWKEAFLMTGDSDSSIEYFIKAISEGHLPPEGQKENYNILAIYIKETNEIIGILELYYGYPNKEHLWVGQLLIEENQRKMGFGKEIIKGLECETKQSDFSKMSIGVHLKNWPALRFWHSMGFDKITKITGDFVYSQNTFSIMRLEKEL